MKAATMSWGLLAPLVGALLVGVGNALQGHPDWVSVITSIAGIIAVFLPAAQLALPWFKPPVVQGEMPRFNVRS